MASWRHESAWLWTVGRIMAALGLLWVSRRLIGRRQSRAIDEYSRAIVPLMAFALLWLLVYSGQRSNA
jgi:hypothetical protein